MCRLAVAAAVAVVDLLVVALIPPQTNSAFVVSHSVH